jgi:hypothetical protein
MVGYEIAYNLKLTEPPVRLRHGVEKRLTNISSHTQKKINRTPNA